SSVMSLGLPAWARVWRRHSPSCWGVAGCNVRRTRMRLPSGKSSGARNFSGNRGSPLSTTVRSARASRAAAHHRAQERGGDVILPAFAQHACPGPAVVGRELNAEQIAEFAVEVGDATLRAGEDAEDEIAMGREALGEQPERDRL